MNTGYVVRLSRMAGMVSLFFIAPVRMMWYDIKLNYSGRNFFVPVTFWSVIFVTKKRIAVLFGGVSSEHEVSRMSAATVLRNIPEEKYEVLQLGITKEGKWLLFTGNTDEILNGNWESNPLNRPAFLLPDTTVHGLLVKEATGWNTVRLDAAIPVLHGKNGEDGTMQGLLQLAGIPFVGCDATSSAACMDKVITNVMLEHAGIPQARFTWLYAADFDRDPEGVTTAVEAELGSYPLFVKPANAGSSVGVSKACNREDLMAGLRKAAKEDRKVLIEENIVGQEVECAVLGNENPIASCVGEIAPSSEFYDYEDKYINGTSGLYIPAHISEETSQKLRALAIKAFRVMGCEGLARVDFFVRKSDGEVLLNELNTLTGFTAISMYPKLMEYGGVPVSDLIDRLIRLALERAGEHE